MNRLPSQGLTQGSGGKFRGILQDLGGFNCLFNHPHRGVLCQTLMSNVLEQPGAIPDRIATRGDLGGYDGGTASGCLLRDVVRGRFTPIEDLQECRTRNEELIPRR